MNLLAIIQSPGGMKAGFEYYRAFPIDAIQNEEIVNKSKLQTPVLVLAGDYYPTFGGDVPGNPVLEAIKSLAVNVSGLLSLYQVIGFQKNSQNL